MVSEKFETGMALQALALTGGLGLTVQSAVTKVLAALPMQSACEQAPAGKGISRPWERNFSSSFRKQLCRAIIPAPRHLGGRRGRA
jgi:hypothetical protein